MSIAITEYENSKHLYSEALDQAHAELARTYRRTGSGQQHTFVIPVNMFWVRDQVTGQARQVYKEIEHPNQIRKMSVTRHLQYEDGRWTGSLLLGDAQAFGDRHFLFSV